MRGYLRCLAGCVTALLALGAAAQGEMNVRSAVAQNSAPVDRAAGNGSMGMGEGLDYRAGESERRTEPSKRKYEPADETEDAELRHGGNETDMTHRRRPTLGDGQD